MVAYSFQRFFCRAIADGRKCQTIRAPRRRHAKPGERLQLYFGMRTKFCRKLIPDPVCVSVVPVRLVFGPDAPIAMEVDGEELTERQMEVFAQLDGFRDVEEMTHFWWGFHGDPEHEQLAFEGVLIRW